MRRLPSAASLLALALLSAAPALADTPVTIFGTDTSGNPQAIGAVSGVAGLYRLQVTGTITGTVDAWSQGTAIASTQTTIANTATSILASSTTRRAVTFHNESATVSFWVGPSGVATTTGTRILPGSSATFSSSAGAAWFGITSSSTAVCDALTESN